MYPTPVKSLFENTMGNPFLDFLKYCMEIFKKKIYIYIDILISNLLSESIFNFGKLLN